jgi:GAF domain-containing protein
VSQIESGEGTPTIDRERLVGKAFVGLADTLVDDYDMIELLNRLVSYSVELLGAEAAGIVLGDVRGELRVVAASSETAGLMELLQLQTDEGPCLDCFSSGTPVSVPDLTQAADRWPHFAAAAIEHGAFASVHALPLRLRKQAIGALNLFHRNAYAVMPAAETCDWSRLPGKPSPANSS